MKDSMEVEAEQLNENHGTQEKKENCEADELTESKKTITTLEVPAEGNVVEKTDGNQEEIPTKDGCDVYAYTRREEFTSENFKIELRGLPRYYHVGVREREV